MLYLVIASLIWGVSFGLMKKFMIGLDPAFVAWGRLALAVPIFLPLLKFKGLSSLIIFRLAIIGAVQYGLLYSVYTYAYQYLYGYQVALFTALVPLYITFIDGLNKKTFNILSLFLALLAIIGTGIIEWRPCEVGGVSKDVMIGFLLIQFCNFCFALGQMEYRKLRKAYPNLIDRNIYAILYISAVVVCSIWTTYLGGWSSFNIITEKQVIVLIFLGVFATGISFFLWNVGATKVCASSLAVMNNSKVPLAVLVSILVFHEQANIQKLCIGGGIMLLAIWLSEKFNKKA